jgi:hypothetical protein
VQSARCKVQTMIGCVHLVSIFLFLTTLISTSLAADCTDQTPAQCEAQGIIGQVNSLRSEIASLRAELGDARREIADLRTRSIALSARISVVEQKTAPINVNEDRLELRIGAAHFHFPSDGNMTVGFDNNIVCFAANDKTRPNANDSTRCFKR